MKSVNIVPLKIPDDVDMAIVGLCDNCHDLDVRLYTVEKMIKKHLEVWAEFIDSKVIPVDCVAIHSDE